MYCVDPSQKLGILAKNMSASERLSKAPIVEAVIDIDCDMPPSHNLASLENDAKTALGKDYPQLDPFYLEQLLIEKKPDALLKHSATRAMQALRFFQNDRKQLVQVRIQGFSFNRLAPYSSLDAYLPEIQRTWGIFVEIAAPIQTRVLRLRYVNKIALPLKGGGVELKDYLKLSPQLFCEPKMHLTSFVYQNTAVDPNTRNEASIVLTSQPTEGENASIIFDISVWASVITEPKDWASISGKIISLRILKNAIFNNMLTDKCLSLFQ
jgi:uncharacterized protein (TIGR04255 family)